MESHLRIAEFILSPLRFHLPLDEAYSRRVPNRGRVLANALRTSPVDVFGPFRFRFRCSRGCYAMLGDSTTLYSACWMLLARRTCVSGFTTWALSPTPGLMRDITPSTLVLSPRCSSSPCTFSVLGCQSPMLLYWTLGPLRIVLVDDVFVSLLLLDYFFVCPVLGFTTALVCRIVTAGLLLPGR